MLPGAAVAARGFLCAALLTISSSAQAAPQRVVSLNLCADELALRLADPGTVRSVTFLSQDPRYGNLASLAAAVRANRGLAEEALAYRPDLVLAGGFSDPATVFALKRFGARVVEIGGADSLEGARKQIRDVAAALDQTERGEALIAEIDRRVDEVTADPRLPRLRAVVLRPNGYSVGPGSLADEILSRAGLINVASQLGADRQVPLEVLARLDADVLILDREDNGGPSLAGAILDHPVVQALSRRMTIVSLPSRLWTCGGPEIAEAVRRLVAATAGARAREATQ
ncbi:MAG: ABC transporter substrate-binding protein [Bradyrhizobium sp.]|nr:MAG: ABC transporter substrate-binding protein [Bradyrhizobium sp.]